MVGIMILVFVILVIFGSSIAVALGVATIIAIMIGSDFSVITVAQKMITGIDSYTLLSIPLFMLTGRLMNEGGITDRIFSFARVQVGHIRGGLGHVNVLASMIFAGMSGSAVADAGGLGQVEMKAMNDQGYKPEFSAAVTAASSVIGPIIPPSIPLLIYAAIAEVSPGKLFLAGLTPGILMGISLMITIYLLSFKYETPTDHKATYNEFFIKMKEAFLPLMTPVIILGGIMGGIFTPTEAASVAVVYSIIIGSFIYKTIKIKNIPSIIIDTLITSAVVTFIISASNGFSWVLIIDNAARTLLEFLTSFTTEKIIIILILNILMIALGCVMEAGVLIILLTPLFLPIAEVIGIDKVQFGVMMVLNLMLGVVTPPIGMGLFVTSEISGVKVEKLMKSILPFLIPLIIVLLLVAYIPNITLWLPNLIIK